MRHYSAHTMKDTYTARGELASITAPGKRQWGFSYDNAGQLSYYTWPNGQRTEYTYDDDGRLTGLVHKDSPASGARTGWQYILGDDGNILRMVDARSAYQADREYEYDHRDRLIRSNWWQADGSPHLRMVYTYDDADNMLSQTRYSYTSRVYDAFTDGDYTSSPAWTVESGTWSAASGALVPTPQSGVRAISTANSYGNADVWYSFKRTGTGGALECFSIECDGVPVWGPFVWGGVFLADGVILNLICADRISFVQIQSRSCRSNI